MYYDIPINLLRQFLWNFCLPGKGLYGWYSSLKPGLVEDPSDRKCMKASLDEEMKLGGVVCPQYLPIIGAVFEFPSYKVKESQLKFTLFW